MILTLININLIITIIAFSLIIIKTKIIPVDPFKEMNNLNEQLKKINNEKLTNFTNNLMNATTSQPMIGYLFVLIICSIPILNIYMIICFIQDLKNKN